MTMRQKTATAETDKALTAGAESALSGRRSSVRIRIEISLLVHAARANATQLFDFTGALCAGTCVRLFAATECVVDRIALA